MFYLLFFFNFAVLGIYLIFPDKEPEEFIMGDWNKVDGVILEVKNSYDNRIPEIKVKFVTENFDWIIGYPKTNLFLGLGPFEGELLRF
jgi:hypothetical protein